MWLAMDVGEALVQAVCVALTCVFLKWSEHCWLLGHLSSLRV